MVQHPHRGVITTLVSSKTQSAVRIDGVESFLLESVGTKLIA